MMAFESLRHLACTHSFMLDLRFFTHIHTLSKGQLPVTSLKTSLLT